LSDEEVVNVKHHLYELGSSSQLEVAVIFAYGVETEALVLLV
jgi:hypothetical protein